MSEEGAVHWHDLGREPSVSELAARVDIVEYVLKLDREATAAPWDCWDMDEFGWHVFAEQFGTRDKGQDCRLSIAAVRSGRSFPDNIGGRRYFEGVANAHLIAFYRNVTPDLATLVKIKSGAIEHLKRRLADAEMSLATYDAGRASEYWLRYPSEAPATNTAPPAPPGQTEPQP